LRGQSRVPRISPVAGRDAGGVRGRHRGAGAVVSMPPGYDDWKTGGADPYYQSAAQEAASITERHDAIADIIKDAQQDIAGILEDAEKALKNQYAELVSVTVDVSNLGVTIEVRS